jgi:hypothetical protein
MIRIFHTLARRACYAFCIRFRAPRCTRRWRRTRSVFCYSPARVCCSFLTRDRDFLAVQVGGWGSRVAAMKGILYD